MINTITLIASLDIDIDKTLGVQFVIFATTMFGLYFIFGKRFLEVRAERFAGTEGSELEAAEFEEKAESILLEYETLLKQAKQDAAEVRDALASQGKEKGESLISAAQGEVDKELALRRAELQQSIDVARKGIHERSEELSNVLVKKVLFQ